MLVFCWNMWFNFHNISFQKHFGNLFFHRWKVLWNLVYLEKIFFHYNTEQREKKHSLKNQSSVHLRKIIHLFNLYAASIRQGFFECSMVKLNIPNYFTEKDKIYFLYVFQHNFIKKNLYQIRYMCCKQYKIAKIHWFCKFQFIISCSCVISKRWKSEQRELHKLWMWISHLFFQIFG